MQGPPVKALTPGYSVRPGGALLDRVSELTAAVVTMHESAKPVALLQI
jgi:hypothetical protein